jgi:hypothetical protein
VMGAQAQAAAAQLTPMVAPGPKHEPARDGSARSGLERIATLLEEIEKRREVEMRRSTSD